MAKMDNTPAPGRTLHLLSPIVFPIEESRPRSTGKPPDQRQ
jgi:hypothetical protein